MTTLERELVEEYLRRLEKAAGHLDRARRDELVAEIRDHIETALRGEGDEASVRNVLERLGPPEGIVETPEPRVTRGGLEVGALIALVIPFFGWLIGVVLVLGSRVWSGREKIVGVLLALLPALAPLLLIAGSGESGTESVAVAPYPWGRTTMVLAPVTPVGPEDEGLGLLEAATFAFVFVAGVPSALYLGWRLRRAATGGTADRAR